MGHASSPTLPFLSQQPRTKYNNPAGTRLRVLRCLLPTLEAFPPLGQTPQHEWCPEFTSLILAVGAPKLKAIEIRRSAPNAFPRAGALSDVALLAATPALETLTLNGLFTPPSPQPLLAPPAQQPLLLLQQDQNPQSDEGFVALLEAATTHHRTVLPSLSSLHFEVGC